MSLQENDIPVVTRILFKNEARKALYEGLAIAAEAVCSTLGPRGKTVLIQRNGQSPIVTKDGVTVSRSIKLKKPVMKMGAELIKEAASQTNDVAGDGTTTATCLTYSLVKEGMKLLEAGYSSKELCSGLEDGFCAIDQFLLKSARKLTSISEIAQVATISANGDEKIGNLIADAMDRVGRDGIITVEDAKGMSTSLDLVEGMQFERGYLSPYFVTNSERMNVVYHDVKVLVTDKKLSTIRELVPILEKVMQSRSPLLIIAEEVEGEALQGLVLNRVNAQLPVVAVKAPGYGQHRDELLRDIAVLSGATLISSSTGLKIETTTFAELGTLKTVTVDAKTTTLVASGATKVAVEKHVADLKLQSNDVTIDHNDLVKLKTRIARLSSGVAVIRVGGATEVEMIERKYRIEDALNATKAAAEGGIVAGGGMALFDAHEHFASATDNSMGMKLLLKGCLAPLARIVQNTDMSPEVVLNDLSKKSGTGLGWNAAKNTYEDLFHAGVIDPVKVTRTALKNAVSVAVTFLSLDAVVVEDTEDGK